MRRMTGGPGCSSELAVFYGMPPNPEGQRVRLCSSCCARSHHQAARAENGPFKITEELELRDNPYGWDQSANMLFIDQPINTGCTSFPMHQGLCRLAERSGALSRVTSVACGAVRVFLLC